MFLNNEFQKKTVSDESTLAHLTLCVSGITACMRVAIMK